MNEGVGVGLKNGITCPWRVGEELDQAGTCRIYFKCKGEAMSWIALFLGGCL